MKQIFLKDIKVDESSYIDPYGFVFHFNNELYRTLTPESAPFYRSLFKKGIIEKLSAEYHLVESELTDFSLPEINCNSVIKHRKIEPVTYCVEWSPSMLKKAAIATLELSIALLDYDCMLQDAYPWNVMFDSTKPVFVDLTSIVPIQNRLIWPAYQQFINFFLNPSKLASMGKANIARLLLYDYINGITLNELNSNYSFLYSLKHPLQRSLSSLSGKIEDKIQNNPILKLKFQQISKRQRISKHNATLREKFFNRILKKLKKLRVFEEKSTWSNYYSNLDKGFNIQKKVQIVQTLISQLRPKSVLDVGSNIGRYSIIAAKTGARVISIDSSEYCIEQLFNKSATEGYRITPIIGDIINPTPAFGFLSKQFPSLIQRVKSDVVLCLALMHHLHINGRQSFDRIALLMNELSNKAVIFEYVDATDNNIHLLDHGREIAYSIQTVSESLSKYFELTFYESDRSTRKLILCKK